MAVGGKKTWSNEVIEKSRGHVPLRGGRRVERTPWYISCSLQIGTTKKRQPRSSSSTISRAITSATLGIPNSGVDAGINLSHCQSRLIADPSNSSYLAASSRGVLRMKPSAVFVAVVSMLKASSPCPLSDKR